MPASQVAEVEPEALLRPEEALMAVRCELDHMRDGVVRVIVSGVLDMAAVPSLQRALFDACADRRLVVVDLQDVSFCDSTGLHLLIRADRRARDEGHRLVIMLGSDQLRRLFAISGVDEQLEIVESTTDIMRAEPEPRRR